MRFAASPRVDALSHTRFQQVIEPKLPFLCLSFVHMAKRYKRNPGSPTEPVSNDVTRVQDNAPQPPMANQEMNKPFTLVSSVPHDEELSAVFSPIMVETAVFPADRDNNATHMFIVNKITNMPSEAMKSLFTMTSEIHNALRCLVKEHCKHDATRKEYFWFLMSHRPNNSNIAITSSATCQQCLQSDSPPGRFIWVYPPKNMFHTRGPP